MNEALPSRPCEGALRKAAFGRTNLFLSTTNVVFKEIRCSISATARQASTDIFHTHIGNNEQTKPANCVCWHCCHPFDGNGFRLPRIFDPTDGVYHVYGWYCSANCAKGYVLEHSMFDRGYQMNILVRMLREVYGIHESVREAPPRTSLQMFGGPFDIEAFRKQQNVCSIVTPPFISYCMLVQERPPEDVARQREQGKTGSRGSVKGLRRPAVTPLHAADDDICAPPTQGMYAAFLETQKESTPAAPESEAAPPAKRGRVKANGLAKFAVTT